MAQSQHQNQKIGQDFLSSLETRVLCNDHFELTFLPSYGCYWKALRIHLRGKWIDLLKPLEGKVPPLHFGSYAMAPWSNRIVRAAFEFEGKTYQLRKNFPDDTAIHGDSRTRPWTVEAIKKDCVEAVLDSRNFSDFNFPFKVKFRQAFKFSGAKLNMSLFIENLDRGRIPAGFGFHPFFKRRLTNLDQDVIVLLPAEKVYPDKQCIPTGPAVPVSGGRDLRTEHVLGNPDLDDCFTDLTDQTARFIYSGSKVEAKYQMDPVFSHVVVYAPNNADNTPRDFVAVEPVTHVNNGFNFYARGWSGTGVKVLEPGEVWGGTCTLSVAEL